MAEQITLTSISNAQQITSAATAINNNNSLITTAFQDTLSLSGITPNQMQSNLDMNSNQILNLPSPATLNSPVRLGDVLPGSVSITVPTVGTSGATVPLLNANNTWSGVQTFGNTDIVSNGATQSFPASGIIVGTTDTQTLTNKTLTTPVISTIDNTGVLTLPTSTDTLVGRATTDTLTNKTLTSPTITGTGSIACGAITSSSNISATGTVSGSNLEAVQVAGKYLLGTYTASNSATLPSSTSIFTSTYSMYEIMYQNLVSATTEVQLELQVYSGGAYKTSGYLTASLTASSPVNSVTTYIPLSTAAGTNAAVNVVPGYSGLLRCYNPSSTANPVQFEGTGTWTAEAANVFTFQCAGCWNTSAAITGFQMLFSSGNITSGIVKVYGIV